MVKRILAAIDGRDAGQATVAFSADVARRTGSSVCVLHVVEYAGPGCTSPLETRAEADVMVERAVFELRMAGVGAEGIVLAALRRRPSSLIIRTSKQWNADLVTLGRNYLRGVGRLSGSGTRDRVVRRSPVPVLVTPPSYVLEIQNNRTPTGAEQRGHLR